MREFLVSYGVPLAFVSLCGGLLWVLAQAGLWLGAQKQNTWLFGSLAFINNLAAAAVRRVEATKVDLAEATADGKVTDEEWKALCAKWQAAAVAFVKEDLIAAAGAKLGLAAFAAQETLIVGKIEREVARLKESPKKP